MRKTGPEPKESATKRQDSLGALRYLGLGLLIAAAALSLLRWIWLLIIGAGWSVGAGWLFIFIPLAVVGAALLIAGSVRTANNSLTAGLACSWIYSLSLPGWLAFDYTRPPPCCFDAYGLFFFVGLALGVLLTGLASIFWFVGYLETDLPRGQQLAQQGLGIWGLGLGAGLAIPILGFLWSVNVRPELDGGDKDWYWGIGSIILALVASGLTTWMISRIKPPAER